MDRNCKRREYSSMLEGMEDRGYRLAEPAGNRKERRIAKGRK